MSHLRCNQHVKQLRMLFVWMNWARTEFTRFKERNPQAELVMTSFWTIKVLIFCFSFFFSSPFQKKKNDGISSTWFCMLETRAINHFHGIFERWKNYALFFYRSPTQSTDQFWRYFINGLDFARSPISQRMRQCLQIRFCIQLYQSTYLLRLTISEKNSKVFFSNLRECLEKSIWASTIRHFCQRGSIVIETCLLPISWKKMNAFPKILMWKGRWIYFHK